MGLFGPSKKDLARLARQDAPRLERLAQEARETASDHDRTADRFDRSGDPGLAETYRQAAREARETARRLDADARDARRS